MTGRELPIGENPPESRSTRPPKGVVELAWAGPPQEVSDKPKAAAGGNQGEAPVISDRNGIKRLKLPKGFGSYDPAPVEVNDGEDRVAFEDKKNPDAKICASKYEMLPNKEALAALNKILAGKPPHKLTDKEIEAITPLLPKPSFGAGGANTITAMETRQVNGKTVLFMDMSDNNANMRYQGYFFNPKGPKRWDQSSSINRMEVITRQCLRATRY